MNSSNSSDYENVIIMYYLWRKCQQQKRSMWIRQILLNKEQLGKFHTLVPQLPDDDKNFTVIIA